MKEFMNESVGSREQKNDLKHALEINNRSNKCFESEIFALNAFTPY